MLGILCDTGGSLQEGLSAFRISRVEYIKGWDAKYSHIYTKEFLKDAPYTADALNF